MTKAKDILVERKMFVHHRGKRMEAGCIEVSLLDPPTVITVRGSGKSLRYFLRFSCEGEDYYEQVPGQHRRISEIKSPK